jgi:hypothetical protein
MKHFFTLFTVLIAVQISYGQGLFDTSTEENKKTNIDFTGYVRGVALGASEKYDLSTSFSEICIKPQYRANNTYLFADLRFRTGIYFKERSTDLEIAELYGGYSSTTFDFFIGNQVVTWGRADGFNPTNVLTPTDYFFLSPEPDDQTISSFMLRTKLRVTTNIELDAIGIPFFNPSVYKYELFLTDENTTFTKPDFPELDIKNGSYGARLNFEYPVAGFSLSYSAGYSNFYGFKLQSFSIDNAMNYSIINQAKTFKQNTIGADFTIPFKSINLRGEIAYKHRENYKDSMFIPNPEIAYVTGLEFNFWETSTILQYVGKYTLYFSALDQPAFPNPTDPQAIAAYAQTQALLSSTEFNRKTFDQQKETNHALMVSFNRDFLYSALNTEITAYYNFTSESYMFRPVVKWNINDMLTAKIGASVMHGPEGSLFDYSAPILSGGFASLVVNFQN